MASSGVPRALAQSPGCHCGGFYANATCQAVSAQGLWTGQGSSWVPWAPPPQSHFQVLRDAQPEPSAGSSGDLRERRGCWWGLGVAQQRGDHWASQGCARKVPPALNTTHCQMGPQQPEWVAQPDFPSGKGAEHALLVSSFSPQSPAWQNPRGKDKL